MAIETKEDEGRLEEIAVELAKVAAESANKKASSLDRSVELFGMMALPFSALYLYLGGHDFQLMGVIVALMLVLSFVGGPITNVPPQEIPKEPIEAGGNAEAPK